VSETFPPYVRSVVASAALDAWPVGGQGFNECSFTSIANALNLLNQAARYSKDEFIREAGLLFQPRLGGTLPFLKALQLRRRGYGAHFGNLARSDAERVVRGLIDQGVPMIVDIYPAFQLGRLRVFGQHATVLVGYSEPYRDAQGGRREEYYLIDAQWPSLGGFRLDANDADRDGDGVVEHYPGNRTLARGEFLRLWSSRNYCPIFPDAAAHRRWRDQTLRRPARRSVGRRIAGLVIGSDDRLAEGGSR
jgi:hypothetical protein